MKNTKETDYKITLDLLVNRFNELFKNRVVKFEDKSKIEALKIEFHLLQVDSYFYDLKTSLDAKAYYLTLKTNLSCIK